MKKRNTSGILAIVLAVSTLALTGCSFSSTVTKTETVTDADGNTTTTTETTTIGSIVATIAFENETGVDFDALYFVESSDDDWGEDILGDKAPLADGEIITYDGGFTYSKDSIYWDASAVDSEGNSVPFDHLDMSEASDPQNITIVFEYDAANDTYTATVE